MFTQSKLCCVYAQKANCVIKALINVTVYIQGDGLCVVFVSREKQGEKRDSFFVQMGRRCFVDEDNDLGSNRSALRVLNLLFLVGYYVFCA